MIFSEICVIFLIGVGIVWWRRLSKRSKRRGKGISILVPFQFNDKNNQRWKNWEWLRAYWESHLPEAEIIIGNDYVSLETGVPFSKACAVNNAASRASGDVFVIVDADGFIPIESIIKSTEEIRKAERKNKKLWYIPYRHFYRLSQCASQELLKSSPENPYVFPESMSDKQLQTTTGHQMGHWFGALIHIVSRKAFEEVGGWDTRFRGWGSEDIAAIMAFDTLYWPHKTIDARVFHIWHPMFSSDGGLDDWVDGKHRVWEGQKNNAVNDTLAGRYYGARCNIKKMRDLVNEGLPIYKEDPELEIIEIIEELEWIIEERSI